MDKDNFKLTPEQIGHLLDDEADDTLRQRVADNPDLQVELDVLREFDDNLHSMLRADSDYPSSTEIGEYVLGWMVDEDIIAFERLLAASPRLRHDVNELREYLDADVDSVDEIDHRKILWAQHILVPKEQQIKVAGDEDESASFTFQAGDHTLLLELQVNYENEHRLIGQFITPQPEEWQGAHVKVHFRDGAVIEFDLDDLNTFDELWSHPRQFVLYIINSTGDVFHTGLISI